MPRVGGVEENVAGPHWRANVRHIHHRREANPPARNRVACASPALEAHSGTSRSPELVCPAAQTREIGSSGRRVRPTVSG